MSSIVFRDLTASASPRRSASPWQQGGLSPGLAMFAATGFGGEPLRVLSIVDEELGAAHMGPRIYRRHNQKHVRNKVRAKIDASHSPAAAEELPTQVNRETGRVIGAATVRDAEVTEKEKERLKGLDLQKLVDECRRCHNVHAVQSRIAVEGELLTSVEGGQALQTLLAAIRIRIADPHTWAGSTSTSVISDDLLPIGLSEHPQQMDFPLCHHLGFFKCKRQCCKASISFSMQSSDRHTNSLFSSCPLFSRFHPYAPPLSPVSTSNPNFSKPSFTSSRHSPAFPKPRPPPPSSSSPRS